MTTKGRTYNFLHLVSAVLMILALLWLTISAPFVYAGQQAIAKQNKTEKPATPLTCSDEDGTNPFGNNTEEKAPTNGSSFSEEYFFSIISQYHKCENAGTYVAYHGELLVPPPNAA
jgi:hypothetical protein